MSIMFQSQQVRRKPGVDKIILEDPLGTFSYVVPWFPQWYVGGHCTITQPTFPSGTIAHQVRSQPVCKGCELEDP